MPAVTNHGPSIATATSATEARPAARASQGGRGEVGMLRSGSVSWDTVVSVHPPCFHWK